ncbi:MAG TPA: class I SAM-dependent methyltransferase [bacterium]|jgi:SAM-dependent methyltransferase
MNWYERTVLPWLIHWVMGSPRLRTYRERVAGAARGRVLELGVGSGHNLRHYGPQVESVLGVDPSERLLALATRAPRRAGLPVELHAGTAQQLPFPAASFDTVVMTWTLCSLPDAPAALAELRRVLRPQGRLLFVEHGLAPEPGVRAWQRRLTPLWRPLAGGCHLDRPIDALVRQAGFRLEQLDCGYAPGPRFVAYMYEGSAQPG